jgi:hypothetical protein
LSSTVIGASDWQICSALLDYFRGDLIFRTKTNEDWLLYFYWGNRAGGLEISIILLHLLTLSPNRFGANLQLFDVKIAFEIK